MPILWRSKILLGEIEGGGYGVDPTPTGADNAILATQVEFASMEGQDVSREQELPWLAAQATIPAGLFSRLSFRVELVPSGTAGTAPAWAPLLRACKISQSIVAMTSATYLPVTDNMESVCFHFWVGTTRFVMKGSRGTVVMRFTAQGVPYLQFVFTGLFALPSNQSRPTPDFSDWLKPDLVTNARTTFTCDGVSLVMRSFSLDLRNDVQTRFLVGSEGVLIVDTNELITFQVELTPLATFDPYAIAAAAATGGDSTVPIVLTHGTAAGRIATLEIDVAQLQRPSEWRNEQGIIEWVLRGVPLPTSGNDQWSLTLT